MIADQRISQAGTKKCAFDQTRLPIYGGFGAIVKEVFFSRTFGGLAKIRSCKCIRRARSIYAAWLISWKKGGQYFLVSFGFLMVVGGLVLTQGQGRKCSLVDFLKSENSISCFFLVFWFSSRGSGDQSLLTRRGQGRKCSLADFLEKENSIYWYFLVLRYHDCSRGSGVPLVLTRGQGRKCSWLISW